MTKYNVLYEGDERTETWSCQAETLLDCIKQFNTEIGGLVNRVIDWATDEQIKNVLSYENNDGSSD